MKKRVVAVLVCAAMGMALMAGCGSSDDTESAAEDTTEAEEEAEEEETTEEAASDIVYSEEYFVSSDFAAEDNATSITTRYFIDLLKERSGGSVEVEEYFNGTLAGSTAALEAIGTGQADFGTLGTLFNPSDVPLYQITMAVPFGTTDPRVAGEAMQEMVDTHPEFEEEFENAGLILLAAKGTENYNMISKDEVTSIDQLKGTVVAVGGVYAPSWFEAIGAATTAADSTQAYQSLKTNVYPATFIYNSVYDQYSLYEVCDYVLEMDGGARCPQAMAFNKATFESLDEDMQNLIYECALDAVDMYYDWLDGEIDAWTDSLIENGVTITEMSAEEKQAWGDAIMADANNSIQAWIDSANDLGYDGDGLMSDYLQILLNLGVEFPFDASIYIQ